MKKLLLSFFLMVGVGVSSATADVTYNLGDFTLAGGESATGTFTLESAAGSGFYFSFDYVDDDGNGGDTGSWASDMYFSITNDDVFNPATYSVGGYDAYEGTDVWSFNGGGSTLSGFYDDTKNDVIPSTTLNGEWTWFIANGWGSSTPMEYNNVTLTVFTAVPEPSSAMVLGLGAFGFALIRRRRS